LDKISSYDIFDNLFPGIVFIILASKFTAYNLAVENIVVGVFLYYFAGVVISRIGSLFVEPVLNKISFIKLSKYGKYVKTSKKDSTLVVLSEVNNMYRTICPLFIVLLFLKGYEKLELSYGFLVNWRPDHRRGRNQGDARSSSSGQAGGNRPVLVNS
jgi:hypothetical protein